jgi:hypothetical protein
MSMRIRPICKVYIHTCPYILDSRTEAKFARHLAYCDTRRVYAGIQRLPDPVGTLKRSALDPRANTIVIKNKSGGRPISHGLDQTAAVGPQAALISKVATLSSLLTSVLIDTDVCHVDLAHRATLHLSIVKPHCCTCSAQRGCRSSSEAGEAKLYSSKPVVDLVAAQQLLPQAGADTFQHKISTPAVWHR